MKESAILGDQAAGHWYYRNKRAALLRLLAGQRARCVLDVGAGSGFFARALLEGGGADEAWCVDTAYPEDRDAEAAGKPLRFRRAIERCDADVVQRKHNHQVTCRLRAVKRTFVTHLVQVRNHTAVVHVCV